MILWNTNANVRKMSIKLDQNGQGTDQNSQMNQKSMSVEKGNYSFLMVLIIAIVGGISIGWYFNKMSTVQSIEVSGNYFTLAADVIAKSAIPIATPSDSISYSSSIVKIESLPYVKQATLRLSPSGKLRIQLIEREPLGLIIQGSSKYYFDEDGVILPLIQGKSVDVPLIYGIPVRAGADTLNSDDFIEMRNFLRVASQNSIATSTLSEIAWSKEEGIVALSNENGIRVVFGSYNYEQSVENWSVFYTKVIVIRGPQQFTTIDLRYSGQIITRES
jgi:cell division protein FtsQ